MLVGWPPDCVRAGSGPSCFLTISRWKLNDLILKEAADRGQRQRICFRAV